MVSHVGFSSDGYRPVGTAPAPTKVSLTSKEAQSPEAYLNSVLGNVQDLTPTQLRASFRLVDAEARQAAIAIVAKVIAQSESKHNDLAQNGPEHPSTPSKSFHI